MHAFFQRRRDAGEPLVLATVYDTEGSTYSKAGARMLIDADGVYQGMLSGGCLEGDLAARARVVLESDRPQTVSYSLDADDELWGLGVGCDGVMRILLQPLRATDDYQPYAAIAAAEAGRTPARAAIVVDGDEQLLGRTEVVSDVGGAKSSGDTLSDLARNAESGLQRLSLNGVTVQALVADIERRVHVLVLGAGLDAEPLVSFAAELGWRCTVADHRPAYVDGNDFSRAAGRVCCPASELAEHVAFEDFDLAVIMSHHLASDREYLRQLAGTSIAWIGLLGPAARRQRLLEDVDEDGSLASRVKGPAGLDLGARGAGAIALSIVAEMQQVLAAARA